MTRIRLPRLWPPGKDGSHADSSDPVPLWTALAYITASAAAIWLTLPASLTSLNLGLLAFFAGLQLVLVNLPVPAAAFDSRGRGFVSLDRLSLVAAVLVLGPAPASWAAGTGILIWTLTGDPRREPWRARVTRAVANGGMFVLATVAAGTIYTKLGGHIPLTSLNLADLGRACLLILILQSVNELLFLLMSWRGMSPTDRRHPLDWRSTFSELTVGLNGIIAALAWTNLPRIGFALYVAFVIVFAFLFKYIAGIAERERERAEESAAVNRVNQAVNSAVSLDELLEIIFREASNLMQFAAFIIAVHDGERDELDVRINYDEGTRRAPTRHKQSEGLLAWTLRHNEPIFITDRRTSNHDAIRDSIIHGRNPVSIIAIPINFGDEIVGILSVQDYRPNAFKQRHLQLLENFAGQIAVAIVNTRLFAELKANQQELESRVRRRTAELELAAGSL
ncbi:MAG TPA: GAF domain-containing protein, partial [Gammaproteobacteria bacterium]|nr:GAF domain-containing protein [Gammaproteobacteria bacterium]